MTAALYLSRRQCTAQGEHSRLPHFVCKVTILPLPVSPGKIHNRNGTTGLFPCWKHGQVDSGESGQRPTHHGNTNSVPIGKWESSSWPTGSWRPKQGAHWSSHTFEYGWLVHSSNAQTSPRLRTQRNMLPTCRSLPAHLWRGSNLGMKEAPNEKKSHPPLYSHQISCQVG